MYVSIRDVTALKAAGAEAGCETVAGVLRALGTDSIELSYSTEDAVLLPGSGLSGEKAELLSAAGRERLREQLEEHNLRIAAFLMSNDFGSPDAGGQIDWILRCAEAAGSFGVGTVRIDPIVKTEKKIAAEEAAGISLKILNEALSRMPATPEVSLGIENHGALGNDPEYLRMVLSGSGDARLGLTLDSGNFYWFGFPLEEVYGVFEEFAPFAKHTHIKNIKYPCGIKNVKREPGHMYSEYVCPVYEGDVDHGRFAAILKKAGYAGDLCIEDESLRELSPRERLEVLRRDAEHLRGILKDQR